MARLNLLSLNINLPSASLSATVPRTHEGAPACILAPEAALRRTVLAALLWEDSFYESGESVADRIAALVPRVEPARVAALAIEARERMLLRHMPLLLVREMARSAAHRALVADTLARVIQRADELAEFVAIYWKDGRRPLSAQVKKGLARAFARFDGYQLAKYDRAAPVRLRDVLFLCHARPRDAVQEILWKQLADGTLPSADTWEARLSAPADNEDGPRVDRTLTLEKKRARWESLLRERRLGALALLRNLRNLSQAGVDPELVRTALAAAHTARVLPFRFVAAAREVPQWEPWIEQAMLASLAERPRFPGRTVLLIDVSGSMDVPLSARSTMRRADAAAGLAVLLRELAEDCAVYSFSHRLVAVPPRRGFALRDAVAASQPHAGTALGAALRRLAGKAGRFDRLIVFTDEQSRDPVGAPPGRGYMVNVAAYRNGVGYGAWTHIDGWSAAVLDYIRELESVA